MSVLENGETCLPVKMYYKIMILKPKFWEGMCSKRRGHMYAYKLIRIDVWQKPTQYLKKKNT